MKRFLFVIIALAALVAHGCRGPHVERKPAPGRPHITLMTYNLNYGLAGDPEALRIIRQANADILHLQETTPSAFWPNGD